MCETCLVDHRLLAAEFLRSLRGKRSQVAFSRRLGYRTNIASRWERARCFPTAAQTFAIARKLRVDVRASLRRFYKTPPPLLESLDLTSPEGVRSLLEHMRGRVTLVEVARELGVSRFRVARWLRGGAEPKLPEFLALVDVLSLRLLEFVTEFVPAATLPSVSAQLTRQRAARDAAFARPWSHAVLRALELRSYRELPAHRPGFLAARLGISRNEETRCLRLLEQSGQVRRVGARLELSDVQTLDLRLEVERLRALKLFWIDVARARLASEHEGTFGFNLFAIAESDLAQVRTLYLEFYQRVQAIVARSDPTQAVVLWNTQLLRLDSALPAADSTSAP